MTQTINTPHQTSGHYKLQGSYCIRIQILQLSYNELNKNFVSDHI